MNNEPRGKRTGVERHLKSPHPHITCHLAFHWEKGHASSDPSPWSSDGAPATSDPFPKITESLQRADNQQNHDALIRTAMQRLRSFRSSD